MNIKVLASGSKGNCYILQGDRETLIIECGISCKDIIKGLNFNIKNVIGCLVTHEHKDHSKVIGDLIKNGVEIFTSKGTIEALKLTGHRINIIESEKQFQLGEFTILPFQTQHDAAEPLGFLIQHKDIGKLLFATDTYYIEYKFKGLNHIFVECNYSAEILQENVDQGIVPYILRNRLLKSHFSLANFKEFLKASDLTEVQEVVLLHLSSNNSSSKEFKEEIERHTGMLIYVAEKGLNIDLSTFLIKAE